MSVHRVATHPNRALHRVELSTDFVVAGGGLAGTCAAIAAAREGRRVVLVQDRPVLGGNASSEVRLWALGATSHMGNNNRWSREGGIVDELLVENLWRNPDGNPVFFDLLLLDKVAAESNITLLLNTALFHVRVDEANRIGSIDAFCSQNETLYTIESRLFCDGTGNGTLGHLAGASYRIGSEAREEFNELLAPDEANGELLGHSIFFYTKDVGHPVAYIPPEFALKNISEIPHYRRFSTKDHGCSLWWLEYGGRRDTILESEDIKTRLWSVAYGVWDHIKNSGDFPDAESMTLEWIGLIPGKRESRRFEGDLMLSQSDIVEQRTYPDAVSFGGWAIDLHPSEGVFSELDSCTQYHGKGVYQIPYRTLYSRDVPNLFITGRLISSSHVAFGSTRVMLTCGHNGQAVGVAAGLCAKRGIDPRELANGPNLVAYQTRLDRTGQFIPHLEIDDPEDFVGNAAISATSTAAIAELPADSDFVALDCPRALVLPAEAQRFPKVTLTLTAAKQTALEAELRASSRPGNFTPDVTLAKRVIAVPNGGPHALEIDWEIVLPEATYVFLCVMKNPDLRIAQSSTQLPGFVTATHSHNRKVAKGAVQMPPAELGVDTFEFWLPERRPGGKNLAVRFDPPLRPYSADFLATGPERPFGTSNAWMADPGDPAPAVRFSWPERRIISRVIVALDTDFDHAMETVQWGHPERIMPLCARHLRLRDESGRVIAERRENHQTRLDFRLETPVETQSLTVEFPISADDPNPPVAFRVRIFGNAADDPRRAFPQSPTP